jgi:uroporphyrinogen decarboxylase
MTPRERVLQAMERKPTDRAPADYNAHASVTARLIEKLGLADAEELLQVLGVDMRRIACGHRQPLPAPDADGYVTTMWGPKCREKDPGDGRPNYIAPFNEDTTVDDVHAHAWPDPGKIDYSQVRGQCLKFHGEYATLGSPWCPFFHEAGWIIGQEEFYIWMHTKPEVTHAVIGHIVDYEIEVTRRFLDAADGMIDITYFGNDFGTQRSLIISPQMWNEFIRRPLKRFYDISHDYRCRVMQHSCGSIRGIIPWLIEDGLDILDPIQTAAADMGLAGLMRDFGPNLCFHGGVDTQQTLPFGSEADVRAETRSYLGLCRNTGGYILASSQEFIEDVPLDNILAMYDENQRTIQPSAPSDA